MFDAAEYGRYFPDEFERSGADWSKPAPAALARTLANLRTTLIKLERELRDIAPQQSSKQTDQSK